MPKSNTQERLKELMQIRSLRQVDILNLAKPYCRQYDIKLSKSDLSQYVSGISEPRQNKLFILARALNVSEAWLMGFDVPIERVTTEPTTQPHEVEIFQYDNTFPITLTPHETKVITAYRDRPEMQPAVDTLLGVSGDEEYIPVAARNGKSGTIMVTASQEERKAALDKELPGVSTPKKPDTF